MQCTNAFTAMQILGISLLLASIVGVISVNRIAKCEPRDALMVFKLLVAVAALKQKVFVYVHF